MTFVADLVQKFPRRESRRQQASHINLFHSREQELVAFSLCNIDDGNDEEWTTKASDGRVSPLPPCALCFTHPVVLLLIAIFYILLTTDLHHCFEAYLVWDAGQVYIVLQSVYMIL
jgi:hypothetical protein